MNLIMLGIILITQHITNAHISLTIGFILFCIFTIPAALINYLHTGSLKVPAWFLGITFLTILFLCSAVLFKVMHLPGESIVCNIGFTIPFFLFLPSYLILIGKLKEIKSGNSYAMAVLVIIVSVFCAFQSLNFSKDILVAFTQIEEADASTIAVFEKRNKLLCKIASANDSQTLKTSTLKTKADELCSFIRKIQNEISVSANSSVSNENTLSFIAQKDDTGIPARLLFSADNNAGKLKELINNYRQYVCSIIENNESYKEKISKLLDTDNSEEYFDKNVSWEEKRFYNHSVASVYSTLTNISCNVRIIEWQVLNYMVLQ